MNNNALNLEQMERQLARLLDIQLTKEKIAAW
jgi:hypothetical protein